jgi:hypothetical protein
MSRRPFRDVSIRAKLLWIVMLTSSIALIAAGVAIVAYDSITFTQQKQNDLATQAAILAATSSAALEFNDSEGGQGIPRRAEGAPRGGVGRHVR